MSMLCPNSDNLHVFYKMYIVIKGQIADTLWIQLSRSAVNRILLIYLLVQEISQDLS